MAEQDLILNFDLNGYASQLVLELDSHLHALRINLSSIENGTYRSSGSSIKNVITIAVSIPDPESFKKQEINKTFKSCVTSLQDYIDKLIGVKNFAKGPIILDRTLTGQGEINAFIRDTEKKHINDVAKNKKLTIPKKLDFLYPDVNQTKIIVDGYFQLRNSLEHHKGIADRNIDMIIRELSIFAGDEKIEELPYVTKENTGINIGIKDIKRTIAENSVIEFSGSDIEAVINTIKLFVVSELAEVVSQSIRGGKVKIVGN